jgi:hypothetical protein
MKEEYKISRSLAWHTFSNAGRVYNHTSLYWKSYGLKTGGEQLIPLAGLITWIFDNSLPYSKDEAKTIWVPVGLGLYYVDKTKLKVTTANQDNPMQRECSCSRNSNINLDVWNMLTYLRLSI